MARRMQPTAPSTGSTAELLQPGVCGTRYMERFGGHGRHCDPVPGHDGDGLPSTDNV